MWNTMNTDLYWSIPLQHFFQYIKNFILIYTISIWTWFILINTIAIHWRLIILMNTAIVLQLIEKYFVLINAIAPFFSRHCNEQYYFSVHWTLISRPYADLYLELRCIVLIVIIKRYDGDVVLLLTSDFMQDQYIMPKVCSPLHYLPQLDSIF